LRLSSREMLEGARSRVSAMRAMERFLRLMLAIVELSPWVRCWLDIRAWIRF
jgi:hypothetical protein